MRAFRVAYDGRDFFGLQRQPAVRTVENALFTALGELEVFEGEKPAGYAAAGRTDAGVSALAQTVAFECPDWLTPAAFNSELPAEIRVWAAIDVPAGFHATHDAVSRTYRYFLFVPAADADLVVYAVERLRGAHDFANLTPDDTGTERVLDVDVELDGDFLTCSFTADGFPRAFVRRAVTLIEAVATGTVEPGFVDRVLDPTPLEGPEGVASAPPEPLVLVDVTYPDVSFEVDPGAVESLNAVFGDWRTRALAEARVAETILDGVKRSQNHDRAQSSPHND